SGSVRPLKQNDRRLDIFKGENLPFSMTNKGLHISLPLVPEDMIFDERLFIAPLRCCWAVKEGQGNLYPAIPLLRPAKETESYWRVSWRTSRPTMKGESLSNVRGDVLLLSYDEILSEVQKSKEIVRKYIFIPEIPIRRKAPSSRLDFWTFSVDTSSLEDDGFVVSQYAPQSLFCHWTEREGDIRLVITKSVYEMVARVLFVNNKTTENIVLAIIVKVGCSPCLLVITPDSNPMLENITSSLYDLLLVEALHIKGASLKSVCSVDSAAAGVLALAESSVSDTSSDGETSIDEKRLPLDRISQRLRTGKAVSASLRHIIVKGGGQRFLIDIGIDFKDPLRWPAPAWVEALLSLLLKKMKAEEQNPDTPASEQPKKRRHR
ncbi:hypothetical protein N431DRAFT_300764, partial [Stipitochalara longipes BDJ]